MTISDVAPVTQLTVSGIAAAVAAGETTPTDVLEAYLARIEALDSRVQAWCYLDRERARAEAATLTEEARAGKPRGPLHGVPIGIKDEFHVEGMPTYMASPDGHPQPEDATPVARLRAAGAIILGKTHMPIDGQMPPTRNPWNLAHTAGGTSSGSGAAVGARMAPIALGEQTAGSNLRPAAYNGVAGLKPTFGRISRFGCYPFSWSHDHVGIIGLTMADIALVYSIIGGPDPRDPTSRPESPPPAELDLTNARPPRIGVVRNFYPERTEPVMQSAIEDSASRLKAAGATVTDALLPDEFPMLWMIHRLINGVEGGTFRARRYAEAPATPLAARDLAASLVPAAYYLQAQRIRRYLWQKLQGMFADFDMLLMAVASGAAPEGIQTTGEATLLIPWSCVGFPAITLNGGLSPKGLPLGLQFVGPPMADYLLMRHGAWCETVLGRLPAPPIE